ncbi:MAG: DUF1330 domain-containing protein [Actinomycetota bacterium]
MSNSTVLITLAQPNPDETERFHRYVGASTELSLAVGAEVSSRFGVRPLIGDVPAAIFGLATFPDADTITTLFDGDAYRALVPDRDKSLDAVNAYIVDDAAATSLPDPDGVYLVVVAAPNPEAIDDLQAYQAASGPLFAKHGATPVAQFPVSGRPVGDTPAAFVAVLAFPSADAAEAVFADPDYQAIVPMRDRGLASLNVYVTV